MSNKTTTTTDTSNNYNSAALGNYNSFQNTLGKGMSDYALNPLMSSFFNQQLGMGLNNSNMLAQRNMSNITRNLRTGGGLLGGSGSFLQSQINRAGLSTSANNSSVFGGALNSALANRQWALSSMQNYQPLQTGQNTVQTQQTKQGLGSILGSVAGIGLNFLAPGLGSMLGGGSFSGGYQANPGVVPAAGSK